MTVQFFSDLTQFLLGDFLYRGDLEDRKKRIVEEFDLGFLEAYGHIYVWYLTDCIGVKQS